MKSENVLEKILEYVNTELDHDTRAAVLKATDGPRPASFGPYILSGLIADLTADICKTEAKAGGQAAILKTALKIIKNAPQPSLRGAIMQDGKQYFCDGLRAIRLTTPLDKIQPPPAPGSPDMVQLFAGLQIKEPMPLDLPSASELKNYITIKRAEKVKPVIWDFGPDLPAVDAEYLLDIITALPAATATHSPTPYAPLHFHDPYDNMAILMPIRRRS